jgi:hypothetical protein
MSEEVSFEIALGAFDAIQFGSRLGSRSVASQGRCARAARLSLLVWM